MPKILVIEDERTIRANIVDLLKLQGFELISAENGEVGLELAIESLPDLIICDVLMPKMDGFEVLRQLSQEPSTQAIPFIFLTAKTERADFRQGMELGAYDYLTKPFTQAELLGTVNSQLRKRDLLTQQYTDTCAQIEVLKQKVQQLQQFTDAKNQLLNNLIQELREPLSNINMSIRMLKECAPTTQRDRYLKILQEEFTREIALLNQVSELQQFLTPANVKLLRQFNLLQTNPENISDF